MKKQLIAAVAILAMLGLTACGEGETNNIPAEKDAEVTIAEEPAYEANEEAKKDVTDAQTEAVPEAETVAVPTELSDKYADLDNRSFILDGHFYTLGVATLQDFLDNGAEFDKTENYDKQWTHKFRGQVDYGTIECDSALNGATLSFANLNDEPVTMKECVLVGITYLNKFEYERKGSDSKLQFAFPNTLTLDELTANSGEPTAKSGNRELSYTVVSTKYPKYDSGYTFYFDNEDVINGVIMEWVP